MTKVKHGPTPTTPFRLEFTPDQQYAVVFGAYRDVADKVEEMAKRVSDSYADYSNTLGRVFLHEACAVLLLKLVMEMPGGSPTLYKEHFLTDDPDTGECRLDEIIDAAGEKFVQHLQAMFNEDFSPEAREALKVRAARRKQGMDERIKARTTEIMEGLAKQLGVQVSEVPQEVVDAEQASGDLEQIASFVVPITIDDAE